MLRESRRRRWRRQRTFFAPISTRREMRLAALNVELSKKIMSRALHRSVSTLVALLLTTASSSWLRPPPAVQRHAPRRREPRFAARDAARCP